MADKKLYDYSKLDKKVEKIIKYVQSYINEPEDEVYNKIWYAYTYAKDAHEWVFRKSWEPYIVHPVDATIILLAIKPDITSIQSCFLHDVIEDTPKTEDDIREAFGDSVAKICVGLEKVSTIKYRWQERAINTLRKMFVSMADDIRVIFVKLADRLHNMSTIKFIPNESKRVRIASETLNIYVPIAERLGLYEFKDRLEEECFKVLNPKGYRDVKRQMDLIRWERNNFIENVKAEIENVLADTWIDYELSFRIKGKYSIYKKMQQKWVDNITDLYDIFGIRILTNTIADCYAILWYVHNEWKPIPKRIKDYIALPKPNGYQSLHTTIIWLIRKFRQQATEIQIRTHEMDRVANLWVAAHFEYKEKGSEIVSSDIDWVKELNEISKELWNDELLSTLKIDVFKNRIFVLTPMWDALNLPQGSTPIDFAYSIHSDLWNQLAIAKVNGKVSSVYKELKNGDIVEIITDKNKKPNPFWLSFVKTNKAKNEIKGFMNTEDKDKHRDRGKEIINNYLEKVGLPILDKDLTLLKSFDGREFNTEERWQLLEQVWNFSQPPGALIRRILRTVNSNKPKQRREKKGKDKVQEEVMQAEKQVVAEVVIWGQEDMPYTIWKCCEPTTNDKIVAFITSKGKATIHSRKCRMVTWVWNYDRLFPAMWKGQENDKINVHFRFEIDNSIGVLKQVCDVIYNMKLNIVEIHCKRQESLTQIVDVVLEFHDSDYLMIDTFWERVKDLLWMSLRHFTIKRIEEC